MENYRPGALEALDLGYEALAAVNPRLIYASFSAFGGTGPHRERTAYDHVIPATSGIMAMTGTEDFAKSLEARSVGARSVGARSLGEGSLEGCMKFHATLPCDA